jgi:hypothetical protein
MVVVIKISVFCYGEVLFLHDGETRDMKEAIRQIKQMNRLASKRGMLDGALFAELPLSCLLFPHHVKIKLRRN